MLAVGGVVGPRRLTSVRQVSIPAQLLREVGLDKGEQVYFRLSEDRSTIVLIPARDIEAATAHAGKRGKNRAASTTRDTK
jgi:bifunctional DNA-binding transcriptional regulator/antitoxin component of YhaV-PrlF toxin-antitoxin module